ncbi:hypothetical protein LUZ60_011555 [Juncus effusus]|nr:hypothetical protein LUZ60_011555 [Juncus effusus]
MAGTIVSYVLGKLSDVIIKEALFLYGVGEKVESMKRELKRIQCFLWDADMKRKGDARVQHWVNEVKDVAFRIEDAIDIFIVDIESMDHEKCPKPRPRKRDFIKRMLHKPEKLPAIHNLGCEIDQINALLVEISESRSRYGIMNLGECSAAIKRPVRRPIIPEIDETEIVGFGADKETVIQQLINRSTSRRSVVSIVGLGGLGKTTLALKAYNSWEVKKTFDIKIWISISQEFKLIDILRQILERIQPVSLRELKKGEDYLIKKLYEAFKPVKYLIVMDDVWTSDLWTQIEVAFPNVKNGSRVLITTRFINVAKAADPLSEPYELPFLNESESLELFLKKAIPSEEFPDDLSYLAMKFVKKCGGLPLALEVLGGFLSRKPPTYSVWDKILQQMNWYAIGGNCMEIIATSYEDLPPSLKSCFMYFSAFPEDYKIDAKQLIKMWVAEGFILEEENRTMEDTAECYLEELVERCMVQVSKRNYDSSVKYCRIHDLLRDLAIQKAKEDNFVTLLSHNDNGPRSNIVRRAVLHNSMFSIHANPNLRSLLCFRDLPTPCEFRLLRVLSEMGRDNYEIEFEEDIALTHLRYFRRTQTNGIIIDGGKFFFRSISHMKSLQTIDLSYFRNCKIPDSVWSIKTLRHVLLPQSCCSGPPASADLRNLQTLIGVRGEESWQTGLPNLPNIRELNLDISSLCVSVVTKFLSKLNHLVGLSIRSSNRIVMFEMSTFSSNEHMQSLCFHGTLYLGTLAFDVSLFPVYLSKLKLQYSRLEQDPMPILEKQKYLKKLTLNSSTYSYNGKQVMTCSVGGFSQLKKLKLYDHGDLVEWNIEEGAMCMLKRLKVIWCDSLQTIGLHHVTTLQEFTWRWRSSEETELKLKREQEIQNQIKHVASITFKDKREPNQAYSNVYF